MLLSLLSLFFYYFSLSKDSFWLACEKILDFKNASEIKVIDKLRSLAIVFLSSTSTPSQTLYAPTTIKSITPSSNFNKISPTGFINLTAGTFLAILRMIFKLDDFNDIELKETDIPWRLPPLYTTTKS